MSKRQLPPPPLRKQHSWSPDLLREEAWLRRKDSYGKGIRRSKSVTDEDLEELKGCIELGFGFDSQEEMDPKLSRTLPALGFYYTVNQQYSNSISRSSSSSSMASMVSDSSVETPSSIFDPGDGPEMVKTRLRQWAQVVACSVRQSSSG